MKKKNIFQIIIVLTIIVIAIFTYFKFLKIENFQKNVDIFENKTETIIQNNIDSKERNIIEDIKYYNEDLNGNKFTIRAKKGEINENNTDIVALREVEGIINLRGKPEIYIYSKLADYNSNNFDTKFYSGVTTKYENTGKCGKINENIRS